MSGFVHSCELKGLWLLAQGLTNVSQKAGGICCCLAGCCSVWPVKAGGAAAWARQCSALGCCSKALL